MRKVGLTEVSHEGDERDLLEVDALAAVVGPLKEKQSAVPHRIGRCRHTVTTIMLFFWSATFFAGAALAAGSPSSGLTSMTCSHSTPLPPT